METQPKRLTRSTENRVISGVCAGIGDYFDLDPVVVRVIFVVGTLIGIGVFIPVYIALIFIMPDADAAPHMAASDRGPLHQARPVVEVPVQPQPNRDYEQPFRDIDDLKDRAKAKRDVQDAHDEMDHDDPQTPETPDA